MITFMLYMVRFSSVTQLCLTLGKPMDCSMPDCPGHHQLPEIAQTHVHCVSDAIQPIKCYIYFTTIQEKFFKKRVELGNLQLKQMSLVILTQVDQRPC